MGSGRLAWRVARCLLPGDQHSGGFVNAAVIESWCARWRVWFAVTDGLAGGLIRGVGELIYLKMTDTRHLACSLATTLAPSRRSTVRLLREIIPVAGEQGTAALLSMPVWRLNGWLDSKACLRAADKKLIWIVHSLMFHREHLSSLFHVATFARFWCGPYTDSVPLKPRRAARADADRLRRRQSVRRRDRHATGAGEILGAPPVCAWSV